MNKKYKHLSQEQRYTIDRLLKQGHSHTSIAKIIGVDKSTVSREVKRNASKPNSPKPCYNAKKAQQLADERIEFRMYKVKLTRDMQQFIAQLICEKQWSPEQIAGRAAIEGYQMVSKSTIYNFLHEDKQRGGELYKHTRHHISLKKRNRLAQTPKTMWGKRRSIEDRPEIVNDKVRLGDFEMDTIVGKGNRGAILTLVDRVTGYTIINELPLGKNAYELARIVKRRLDFLKRRGQLHSITTDNGTEFSAFKAIERSLKVPIYFARPYCSTDKPHIELLNKLIRQYIPKATPFTGITQKFLTYIENQINNRPRKSLNYKTPKEVFLLNL